MTNGGTIRLAEIAEVKLDYPEETELVRLNGKNSIVLSTTARVISPQSFYRVPVTRIMDQACLFF